MQARIHHVNVPAHDVRRVAHFYSEVLGLNEVAMPVKDGLATPERQQQLVAWFDPGNGQTGLHVVLPQADYAKQFNMFLNPITHGHVAYTVDDIEATKRKLDERGVYYADLRNYLMSDLYQIYTTDPEGNVVEINQELR
jgi:catechol 2,3-dioxygenase-like lactoylglutathione lyase family enzyme